MNRKRIFSMLLASALALNGTTLAFATTFVSAKPAMMPTSVVNTVDVATAAKPAEMTTTNEDEKDVKISKEKAKEIAKSVIETYFNTKIDESKFTQRINFSTSNYNGNKTSSWSVYWDMSNMEKNINMGVTLNAETGAVMQASNYERMTNEENTVPTLTVKEAGDISDAFVKSIEPKKFNESNRKNYDSFGYSSSTNYSFNYVNKVNGIEFDGNNINIEVDGVKGKVVSYYSNWNDDLIFPEATGIIDAKTALDAFKSQVNMNLKYATFMDNYNGYENKSEKDVKLIYSPEFPKGSLVDAKDGKIIDTGNGTNTPIKKDLSEKEREAFYNKFRVVTPREKAIEEAEAKIIVKGLITKLYGDGFVLRDLGYQEYTENNSTTVKKSWNAYFTKGEADNYNESGNVSINAITGEIINSSKYSNEDYSAIENFQPKLTWDQAYTKALEVVAEYYPDKIKEIKTDQYHYDYGTKDKMGERSYYFNFVRLQNGIEYNENNISVGFSAVSGNVNSIYYNWDTNIKFPESKDIVSEEKASEMLFNKYTPSLMYTQINKSSDAQKPELEIKLAYKLSDANGLFEYLNVDALTAKFINYSGKNIDENIGLFKDKIKNSKAEKELSILASRGLVETIDFKLDKKITQIDLIKMLVNTKGPRPYMAENYADLKFSNVTKADANYKYLQAAIAYGIMENSDGEFIGDKLVSREDLAKTLVKFTNYSKLAQHGGIFKVNYKDASTISKENLGYIAIAEAFGFIEIENNEVKPKNDVTMEQLAKGVYNALNNVRNTQY